MTETNNNEQSKLSLITGGQQRKSQGLPGLQIELDSERILELLATGGQQIDGQLRSDLVALATSIKQSAHEINERVMATASYTPGEEEKE